MAVQKHNVIVFYEPFELLQSATIFPIYYQQWYQSTEVPVHDDIYEEDANKVN